MDASPNRAWGYDPAIGSRKEDLFGAEGVKP